MTTLLIDDALAALLHSEAAMVLSAANASLVPELAIALACLVDADRRRLRVVLDRHAAAPLLATLEPGGQVALVAGRPTTLRTVQVKGDDAQLLGLSAADVAEVERIVAAMVAEFGRIDLGAPYASTLLAHEPQRLVAVSFRPLAVFEQTPGPQAGRQLGGAAAR